MAAVSEYAALGLLLPVSTLVGYIMGYLLDKAFGTNFVSWIFAGLGTVAGLIELIRKLNRDSGDGS